MELQNLSPTNLSRLIFAHVYRDRIYTIFHYYEYNLGYYLKLVREEKGHICNMEEDRTLESDRDNDEVSIYSFDSDSDTEDSYGQENYSSPTMMKVEEVNEMGYKSDEGVEYCDSEICALPAVQIISLVKQLLTAVNICHSRGIIHRNIKPKHILVQPGPNANNPLENATLKLSDFALVKNIGLLQRTSTMEVVTLWYRAPEILLGRDSYNSELDMWSVGCVIAEICRLKPLWMGRGRMDQLLQIFSTLSSPSLSIEHKMKTKASTLSLPRSDTKSMPIPGKDGNLCGGIASVEKARDKVENYDNTFTSNFTSDKSPFTSNVSTKIDGIDMNLEYNSYPGFYDLPKVSNYHKYALNEKIRKWHKFDRNRLGEFLPRNIPVDLYRTILLCFRYDPYERISAEELLDIFHSTFSESNPIPDSLTTKACQKKYLIPKDFNPSVIYENVRSIQPSSLNSVSFQESIANSSVVFAKGIFSRNTRINVHNQSKPSVCVTNTPCIRTFTPNLFELNSRSKDYSSLSPGGSISKVAIQSRTYQEGKSCLNEFKLKLVNDIEKITTCKSSGKYFGHLIESEKDNIEQLIKVFQAHRIEGASSTIIKCHFECLFNLMQQFLTYRPILVVWILDIAVTYNLETRTIQLAIRFIDRFILQKFIHIVLKEEETLSKPETKEGNKYDFRSIIRGINFWKEIDKAKLLLVSVAALHTASKIEDVSYIGIDDLVKHAQTSMILWGHQSFFQLYQIQERNVIDFRNEALEEETENEAMEPEINLLGDETLSATNNFLALEIDSTKCLDIEEYLVQELSFRLSGPTFVDYLTVYMTIFANFDFFSIKAKLFNFEALSRRKNGAYTSNESNGEICKNKFIVCDEIIHLVRYLGNICIIYFPFAFFLNLLCSNNEQECQCKKYHFSDLASRNIAIILRKIITRGESYSGNSVFFCCLLISCYISMFSSSSSQFQDYRFSCISNLRIFRITTHYLLETYFHLEGYYNPYSALVIDRKAHISTLVTIVRKLYSLHELQILPEERRNTFHRFTRERDYEENLAEALHIVHKQHESDDFNRVANFVWPNVEELVNYIEEEFSYDFGF